MYTNLLFWLTFQMYLNLGKKDFVEPAIQILSSAYIPTMTYIYSDESLLDQVSGRELGLESRCLGT